jgi:sortase (surface protein transpeptidase)
VADDAQAIEAPGAATTTAAEEDSPAEEASASATSGEVAEIDPLPLDQTTGPVRVQIPEIGLDAPIIAMGWRVAVENGERTTVWDVPLNVAGWHINSAGAGGLGNTVVSGRQVEGAAVFAPLALGSVAPGQEVLLTDGDGITFVYRMTEVTDPIPVTGATPDELARAATYFAPTNDARLTLVTGWPDFTTTHRIFAVAEFVGVVR